MPPGRNVLALANYPRPVCAKREQAQAGFGGQSQMRLRSLLAALTCILLWGSPLLAANSDTNSPVIEVWKSTTCECCGNWVKHLEANGFAVKVNAASPSMLDKLKKDAGIGDKLASCHTAKIDG